jgi:hypothetical protein
MSDDEGEMVVAGDDSGDEDESMIVHAGAGLAAHEAQSVAQVAPADDDYYEDVVVKRDINYANTKRGLEITCQFIIDNNLVLIGGMAIDMALKHVGHPGIYLNEKLPDYDFLSPDSAKHAGELAHLLCKAGLMNVSAINAYHVTTIRVRVNFISVADIGYCPRVIYDRLPTINVGKLRVLHPHFQVIDIHRSLSYPFERAYQPVIFHRWKKDCVRYDLIHEAYPVEATKHKLSDEMPMAMTKIKLNFELLKDDCLAGWAAIWYWRHKESLDDVMVIAGESVQVFTDDFAKYVARSTTPPRYFQGRLGHLPRSVHVTIDGQAYEVFDNLGLLLSAERATKDMCVAGLQHGMMFLLAKVYIYPDTSDELKAYCRALYTDCMFLVANSERPGVLPTINVYGSRNWDESYMIHRRKFAARLAGVKLETADNIDSIYPSPPKCKSIIRFNYGESPYFAISGEETTPFAKRTIAEACVLAAADEDAGA